MGEDGIEGCVDVVLYESSTTSALEKIFLALEQPHCALIGSQFVKVHNNTKEHISGNRNQISRTCVCLCVCVEGGIRRVVVHSLRCMDFFGSLFDNTRHKFSIRYTRGRQNPFLLRSFIHSQLYYRGCVLLCAFYDIVAHAPHTSLYR